MMGDLLKIFIWCKFRTAFSITSNERKISYLFTYNSFALIFFTIYIQWGLYFRKKQLIMAYSHTK